MNRGTCPVCGYRHRLIADGLLARHYIYYGHVRVLCRGTYDEPVKDGSGSAVVSLSDVLEAKGVTFGPAREGG